MTTAVDVSVIISNFNNRAMLEPCLRSVLQDLAVSGLGYEVIVVDDGSTDGSGEMIAALFPEVTLIRLTANLGYARANNVGLRAASGRSVMLLNSDTVVLPGAIAMMHHALVQRPDLAAVGPTLLNADGTVQRSCWPLPVKSLVGNTLLMFSLGIGDDYRNWDHRTDREVEWIGSAALLIRRGALEDVGLLDEEFWVYGVDLDWAIRARRRGYRYLSLSGARIVHYGRSSWATMSERMRRDDLQSSARLFRKHYGALGLLLYRGVVLFNSILRIGLWGVPYLLGRKQLGPKLVYFISLIRLTLLSGPKWAPRGVRRGG